MSLSHLVVITGASRGIGKTAAIEFSSYYSQSTHFILIARDLERLNEVKEQIQCANNKVTVFQIDFSNENLTFDDYYDLFKASIALDQYKEVIVIYNHGTLEYGSIIQTDELLLKRKFEINFFSIWKLLSSIERLFSNDLCKRIHININSSYAHNSTANWSIQCTSRSSRQMLFKCLAKEKPQVKVVNYDPGIVYTDMLKQAYDSNMFSNEFKSIL
jgi:sepiapterin reductase